MTGTTTRRIGIVAAGVIVATLGLTSCSSSQTESAELSDNPVTIRMTWWGGDTRAAQTQEAIDAFEAEYPNITVEPQYADWGGYWDQLATTTAGGDMPDVVQMDELYLASYGSRSALYDLGTLDLDLSNIPDEAVGTGQLSGVQYAAPIGVGVYGVFANADLFEQYGVELPDDESWTWDDYADIADELTSKSNGDIAGTTLIGGWDAGGLKYWARSAGGELFNEEGEVVLDPEPLADMWQYQLDLMASGGMHSAAAIVESQAAGVTGGALATGKVALGVVGYNTQLAGLTEASGADMRLLKLPEPEGVDPNFYKPSMYWSVSSRSEHPAEAALLVDFMLNSETAADIIKTERGIPANPQIRDYITPQLTDVEKAAIDYAERVTPGTAAAVTPNGGSSVEAILQRYTQEVFAGQTQPTEAAEAFVAELEAEVAAAK